jgi:ribonucleoside-triphosphate reductase
MSKCGRKCEVYSRRVVGYHRPINQWNVGKKEEFKDRQEFDEEVSLNGSKQS